mmetsp:Transcript_9709/g.17099  ORF Transcript_9709/g.17099 Transcript_9709/m.17099 type:complete len:275 (-) Transcript_9709:1436-2260(-)
MSGGAARLNAAEARIGLNGSDATWHDEFRDTAWVFVGGVDRKFTEGDLLCVLSQVGEIEDLHLIRDPDTGASKGFAFVKYEDWRSTVLAVDNFSGVTLRNSVLRVNHTRYERPKKKKEEEAAMSAKEKLLAQQPGHAYREIDTDQAYSLHNGFDVFKHQPDQKHDKNHDTSNKQERKDREKRSHRSHRERTSKKEGKSDRKHKRKSYKKEKYEKKDKRRKTERYEHQDRRDEESVAVGHVSRPSVTAAPPETPAERRRRLAALSKQPIAGWDGA